MVGDLRGGGVEKHELVRDGLSHPYSLTLIMHDQLSSEGFFNPFFLNYHRRVHIMRVCRRVEVALAGYVDL